MNLVLGIISIVICTYFGYNYSLKYKTRLDFYSSFLMFNQKMKNNVMFSSNSLKSFISDLKEESLFNNTVKDYYNNKKLFCCSDFSEEEISNINNYLSSLGSGDKKSQIDFFSENEFIIVASKQFFV